MFRSGPPAAVVLDPKLPRLLGKELCTGFKSLAPSVPIVTLSANDEVEEEVEEKVALLELGADDCVTKPFTSRELLARVRGAMRHAKPSWTIADEDEGLIASVYQESNERTEAPSSRRFVLRAVGDSNSSQISRLIASSAKYSWDFVLTYFYRREGVRDDFSKRRLLLHTQFDDFDMTTYAFSLSKIECVP
jgi:DNA-binding response OmpR family regulator